VLTNVLFQTVLEVSGGGGSSDDAEGGDDANKELVELFISRTPPDLDMLEIVDQLKDAVRTPYQVICI